MDKYDRWKRGPSGQIQIQLLLVATTSGLRNVGNDKDLLGIADDKAEEECGELEHIVATRERSPNVDFDLSQGDPRTQRQILYTTSVTDEGFC